MPRGRPRNTATPAPAATRRRANNRPQVPFAYKLVLNQWLLSLFNVKGFEDLAEHLRTESLEGLDENNVHHFHHALTAQLFNLTQLPTEQLLEYDQNIVKQGPVSFKFIISIFENSGLPDFSRRTLGLCSEKAFTKYRPQTRSPCQREPG
jgi:hypothetical protein